jgi:hypothetical protein
MHWIRWILIGGVATGCTSFATVRSAEVNAGSSFTAQAAIASPPGDAAGWFWNFDCASQCNHAIVSGDFVYASGRRTGSGHPYTIGAGLSGTFPYAEAYWQLDTSRTRPFGIGGRAGLPISGWAEHQLYARYDVVTASGTRWLWNPGVVYHTGNSPSGGNPGSFVGLVQGFGVAMGTGSTVFTPSVAVVWGHTRRSNAIIDNAFARNVSGSQVFGTAGMSVTFRRRLR